MLIYVDRGHRTDGGATDEWRQVGVFIDELLPALIARGHLAVRTPDALDSFASQDWVRATYDGQRPALYLACHADVEASRGHVFYSAGSAGGKAFAKAIAAAMPYDTDALSTNTPGYDRTDSCIRRISSDPRQICAVLLELWSVAPAPTDQAIRDVAQAVARALGEP